MATFQLFPSSGQHWYRLRADNGEIIQSSEGYTAKASCENGIRAVQANCQPHRFESFFTAGQHGFNHVAANGEIIGRSGKYSAEPASPRASKPVSSASHSQRRGCRGQQTYWKKRAGGAAEARRGNEAARNANCPAGGRAGAWESVA